ncbi:type I inositol polyphosphate 5-phosphatase 10-like isoform X5 [Triticum dicoccoides]|uniref:type I inositol polyphosphate 5-phosphatase 10-like isoform X5 n=1 Tax=Triticum dicoccoides TaxID=85692 RepID=UPI00188E2FD2|nr:type I inositol polyphosphate 5-phosphatase 10-like isoform X5 [Triticum dicoccoides]XP_037414542.1 type I inositol polyphosphate 5-phosphatase 10-like isoform X5 [Triticum dicoccoides]
MASPGEEKMKGCRPKLFGAKEKKSAKRTDSPGCNAAHELGPSPSKTVSASPLRTLSGVKSIRLSHFLAQPSSINRTTEPVRIFVSTWNVGGKAPTAELNMDDFVPPDDRSDIYVLGFQEIVPLNAGNVLVIEDNEPAARWLVLINQALNWPADNDTNVFQHPTSPSVDSTSSRASSSLDTSFSELTKTASGSTIFQKSSLKAIRKPFMPMQRKRLKACNCPAEMIKSSYRDACFRRPKKHAGETDSSGEEEKENTRDSCGSVLSEVTSAPTARDQLKYNLIVCKQMVGIFVTVWVKKELVQHIGHLRTSCIGRGILGCLGNKGCISVSMTVHQTSFCFICSHLASGQKEGDEFRRNSDVLEIMRLTLFSRLCRKIGRRIPEKILEHDKVIWFGDLNYRIALSYEDTKRLLTENNWDALFEKDQLKIERDAGRVFRGWNEGKIYFAPTYKYSSNSDAYAGETATSNKKRRTPAWCDRILWQGDGTSQLSYYRGESRFSDHRPVCGTFIVEVEALNRKTKRRSSNADMKIGAEELLPTDKNKGVYVKANTK